MTLTLQREYAQAQGGLLRPGIPAHCADSSGVGRPGIGRVWSDCGRRGSKRTISTFTGNRTVAKERAETERYLDLWGCYCCLAEYLDTRGTWQVADSIGMCVYANPLDPLENWYIPDLMQSAIDGATAVHFQRAGSGI